MIMMLVSKLLMISLGNRGSLVNSVRYQNMHIINVCGNNQGIHLLKI